MKKYILFAFLITAFLGSCSDDGTGQTWEFGEEPEKPEEKTEKARFIWIDAAANFVDFANSKEKIERDLKIAKESGFTDVVVDVRPTSGDVLFRTNAVDQVRWLGAWLPGGYTKVERTATWDYLDAFIEIGHKLGLKVHAGINTFAGGNNDSLGEMGLLYRDSAKKDWATSLLADNGAIVNTLDETSIGGAKFFNPVHDDVQELLCQLVRDLGAYDKLDGIILDRARFDELHSDFSDYTRKKFEAYIGFEVANFPADVMVAGTKVGALPSPLPPHFKLWLEFRAKVIHDFMTKAQQVAKTANPDISFGVYVGGWYGSYYGVGVNWASPKYNTAKDYGQWATDKYANYGYADLMDVMLIGAYAAPTSIYGQTEWTVQGFCAKASDKIKGDAVVIGGPDVGNGDWATASEKVVTDGITNSVDAAINACDGYFLFDMIHLKQKNHWQYAKVGIDKYLEKIK